MPVHLFVRSLVIAGRGSSLLCSLDPSVETVSRSNALAQERGGELVVACECVHAQRALQGRKVK